MPTGEPAAAGFDTAEYWVRDGRGRRYAARTAPPNASPRVRRMAPSSMPFILPLRLAAVVRRRTVPSGAPSPSNRGEIAPAPGLMYAAGSPVFGVVSSRRSGDRLPGWRSRLQAFTAQPCPHRWALRLSSPIRPPRETAPQGGRRESAPAHRALGRRRQRPDGSRPAWRSGTSWSAVRSRVTALR